MTPEPDMYDALKPDRGAELRRLNEARLAELEAQAGARIARLEAVKAAADRRREEDHPAGR